MRYVLILWFLASPAAAWQAGIENGVCTLEHSQDGIDIRLTFDPAGPLYSIALTRPDQWPDATTFGIRFDGTRSMTISTDRHMRDMDGRRITVTDTGFGNVLDGLEFNSTAAALSGTSVIPIDLTGAAAPTRAFRTCAASPTA